MITRTCRPLRQHDLATASSLPLAASLTPMAALVDVALHLHPGLADIMAE
jgi:hypothetical protein